MEVILSNPLTHTNTNNEKHDEREEGGVVHATLDN